MKESNKKKLSKQVLASALSVGLAINALAPIASAEQFIETEKEYIVVYKNTNGKQAVMKGSKKVEHEFKHVKAMKVEAKPSQMNKLKKDKNIAYVEENIKVSIANHDFKVLNNVQTKSTGQVPAEESQWDIQAMDMSDAWNEGFTGKGIKVAVIDSGISPHAELDIRGGVSTVDYTKSWYDDNGHGTHVAGSIGAKRDGNGLVGVAPDSEIYAVKAMDSEGNGYLNDIIEGIEWAIQNDMDIINLSLGTSVNSKIFEDMVNKAYANGILLVGANGNDGVGTPVNYPAKYNNVIAVSSVDSNLNISAFSSTGTETEFSAPGGEVVSTYLNGQYAISSGTSMASPHVAGFLAVLKEKNPNMSNDQLRKELQKYVVDLGNTGRDAYYGYGFLKYDNSDSVDEDLDTTPPGEVKNPHVSSQTVDSATIAWTNPTDSDFKQTNLYVNGNLIGSVPKDYNAVTLNGLAPNSTYTITLRTVDTTGNVSNGVHLKVTTQAEQDVTPPAEVTNLSASDVTHNSANIRFTNPKDADFEKANVYVNGNLVASTTLGYVELNGLTELTDYYVTVKTVDKTGNESKGQTVMFTTKEAPDMDAPSDVTELTLVDVTHESAKITFVNPKDADFEKANVYLNGVLQGSTNRGEFLFTNLNPATDYVVTVKTVDVKGNESDGKTIELRTKEAPDVTPPNEVANLTVTDRTHESATITFTNPTDQDFDKANIYLNGILVASTTEGKYEFTGLKALTNYNVKVTTVDKVGNESKGLIVDFTTDKMPDTTPPAEVVDMKVVNANENSLTVNFGLPADEDFAKVNLYLNGKYVGSTTKGSYTFTNLTESTEYVLTAKTVDTTGNESVGVEIKASTTKVVDVTPPAEVTNFQATNVTDSTANLSWTNPTDKDFVKTNIYVNGVLIGSVDKAYNAVSLSGLNPNTSYMVTLKTVDENGNESLGQAVKFVTKQVVDVTPPGNVTNLKLTSSDSRSASFAWTNPKDADFVKTNIYVNGQFIGSVGKSTTNVTINGLAQNTNYTVTLKTVDQVGNESSGTKISFKTKTRTIWDILFGRY